MEVPWSHGHAIFLSSRIERSGLKWQFRKLGLISLSLGPNGVEGVASQKWLINLRQPNKKDRTEGARDSSVDDSRRCACQNVMGDFRTTRIKEVK